MENNIEKKLLKFGDDRYLLIIDILSDDIKLDDIVYHIPSGSIVSVDRFGESNGIKTIVHNDIRYPREIVITDTYKKIIAYYSEYLKLPLKKLSKQNCIDIFKNNELNGDECVVNIQKVLSWCPVSDYCYECGNGGEYMKTPCDHPNDCKHWCENKDGEYLMLNR